MQPSPCNTRSITPPPAPNKRPSSKRCATNATSCGHNSTPSTSPTSSQDGRRRELFASTRNQTLGMPEATVAELVDASIPKFAAGCRWGGTTEAPVVLFPEGAIRVEGTGRIILELCDGHFSLAEIVQKLEAQFMLAPKGKIRAEVRVFLEQLHAKRIIDY